MSLPSRRGPAGLGTPQGPRPAASARRAGSGGGEGAVGDSSSCELRANAAVYLGAVFYPFLVPLRSSPEGAKGPPVSAGAHQKRPTTQRTGTVLQVHTANGTGMYCLHRGQALWRNRHHHHLWWGFFVTFPLPGDANRAPGTRDLQSPRAQTIICILLIPANNREHVNTEGDRCWHFSFPVITRGFVCCLLQRSQLRPLRFSRCADCGLCSQEKGELFCGERVAERIWRCAFRWRCKATLETTAHSRLLIPGLVQLQ